MQKAARVTRMQLSTRVSLTARRGVAVLRYSTFYGSSEGRQLPGTYNGVVRSFLPFVACPHVGIDDEGMAQVDGVGESGQRNEGRSAQEVGSHSSMAGAAGEQHPT